MRLTSRFQLEAFEGRSDQKVKLFKEHARLRGQHVLPESDRDPAKSRLVPPDALRPPVGGATKA